MVSNKELLDCIGEVSRELSKELEKVKEELRQLRYEIVEIRSKVNDIDSKTLKPKLTDMEDVGRW